MYVYTCNLTSILNIPWTCITTCSLDNTNYSSGDNIWVIIKYNYSQYLVASLKTCCNISTFCTSGKPIIDDAVII